MSSFNVIQLAADPVAKEELITESCLYEDPLYLMRSDYVKETSTFRDEADCIRADLSGIAKVNSRKKTVTFLSKKTVERLWLKHMRLAFRTFKEHIAAKKYEQAEYKVRDLVTGVGGREDLYYYDGYCHTPAQLVSDYLSGHLEQTMYGGTVLVCHT